MTEGVTDATNNVTYPLSEKGLSVMSISSA